MAGYLRKNAQIGLFNARFLQGSLNPKRLRAGSLKGGDPENFTTEARFPTRAAGVPHDVSLGIID